MSAVVPLSRRTRGSGPQPRFEPPAPRIALLGTGTVGSAFVARCERLRERGVAVPSFAWLCNSRALLPAGERPLQALDEARSAPVRPGSWAPWVESEGPRPGDVVVDATASDRVAGWHSEWLARGVHVVSANKLGNGGDLSVAQAIVAAQGEGGARYGDSATVGAGLPLLRSIRELVAGGDRIHAIEGVLSGSLAWLFDRHDGARPFSGLVRQARAGGYTEPDPREDLSGEDVRRKLLLLARAAGLALEAHQVRMDPLLPAALAAAAQGEVDGLLPTLDAPMRARLDNARRANAQLRFLGRLVDGVAEVGLRELPAAHPLCGGRGTDNLVAITSCRYREQPLVIRGPGAGAEVTAAALLDDVLRIAAST
ncbi:MAG: homoserine dehydrogenase [Luteimonas sp.]